MHTSPRDLDLAAAMQDAGSTTKVAGCRFVPRRAKQCASLCSLPGTSRRRSCCHPSYHTRHCVDEPCPTLRRCPAIRHTRPQLLIPPCLRTRTSTGRTHRITPIPTRDSGTAMRPLLLLRPSARSDRAATGANICLRIRCRDRLSHHHHHLPCPAHAIRPGILTTNSNKLNSNNKLLA